MYTGLLSPLIAGLLLAGAEDGQAQAHMHPGAADRGTDVEEQPGPKVLLDRMRRATASLSAYSCHQLKQELLGDTLSQAEMLSYKYRRPGWIYLNVTAGPRKGAELLYGPGWNGGKVRAHKGSFPDITVNLDPKSGLLMKDQHHTIDQLGFGYLVDLLWRNVERAEQEGKAADLSVTGRTGVAGRPAHLLELRVPFVTQRHVVQRGEDLWSIAQKYGQDMSLVLHENPQYRKPTGVAAGDVVLVPVFYSPHTVVAVDDRTGLPVRVEVYDSKDRLYEFYEWSALNLDPHLSAADFSPGDRAYHF